MREERKKDRERAHLDRFREGFSEFPEGTVVPQERPDFLVETPQGRIGIEHTEYVRASDDRNGPPPRAREHVENKILWLASREHESRGLPPVTVYVYWNPHFAPNWLDSRGLVASLSNLVRDHLPASNGNVTIKYPHPAWRSLPQEVTSLCIYRCENIGENLWNSPRGSSVPILSAAELQEIVSSKEAKVSSYREMCSEVWLLVVAEGLQPSTHCRLAPEAGEYPFETSFDRAFFLHYSHGLLVELRRRHPVGE